MKLPFHLLQFVLIMTCTRSENRMMSLMAPFNLRVEEPVQQEDISMRQEGGFVDSVEEQNLPVQPDGMVQILLSIIVVESNFTPELNDNVIECLARQTGTTREAWGVFGIHRFAPGVLQAEYYTSTSSRNSEAFAQLADRYVRDGNLTTCVVEMGSSDAAIIFGRGSIEPRLGEISTAGAGGAVWIVAALLGILCFVGLVFGVWLVINGNRSWRKEDYADRVPIVGEAEETTRSNGLQT